MTSTGPPFSLLLVGIGKNDQSIVGPELRYRAFRQKTSWSAAKLNAKLKLSFPRQRGRWIHTPFFLNIN